MDLFLQRLVDGLANGAIYAALALAIVLVFQTSGIVNFAQGEMGMLATYLVWALTDVGVPVLLAILAAMVVSFAGGAALERLLIRRIDPEDHLVTVLVMTGLFTLFGALALIFFGSDGRQVPSPFPEGSLALGSVRVPYATIGALLVLGAVCAGLAVLLRSTKLGLGLRAVAQNRASSALSGLPVGRLLGIGWGLAAALGALAGVLVTSLGLYLEPSMMLPVLVYAMAAATLGGLDSGVGAVVAGLLLGVAESLAVGYVKVLGTESALGVAAVVMLLTMALRPSGLFGTTKVARV
ncbi:MAG: branched-chain amino acid ABC transporter permease [Nocardioidaceae bacterium]|nr:branched-chain amino acid ABC transporter permease [Nocardioidaceae bacterium]